MAKLEGIRHNLAKVEWGRLFAVIGISGKWEAFNIKTGTACMNEGQGWQR